MLEMRIIIYAGGTRAKWEREKLLTYVQKLAPIIFYFFLFSFPQYMKLPCNFDNINCGYFYWNYCMA